MPKGSTRVAAVIGHPIRHSLSPVILNSAFRALGLDWVYVAFDVAPGEAQGALSAMKSLGIDGYSVTMPHKTDVARAVDHLTPEASALDAVNCVSRFGRLLIGHNTDGEGFLRSLKEAYPEFGLRGARCAVVGAGGAARAIIAALGRVEVAEVIVVNRTADRAARAAGLAGAVGRTGDESDIPGSDLVINATPVGMAAGDGATGADEVPFDLRLVRPGQIVADIVYQPLETALLRGAAERGASVLDGLGMLVHQAAIAFEIWTGEAAPVGAMREAALEHLSARCADP
ncbi:MAG: shikimate dehydrogenase [Acidimicrobiales bacterium]|nr:shikimate dehydrogenase [Acidimicrobiales bacterium]